MMKYAVVEMTSDNLQESRSTLLRKVTDQVASSLPRRSEADIRIFSEIIRLLYPLSPLEDRAHVAELVSACGTLPEWLVLQLAQDQPVVANPILTGYRGFREPVLLKLSMSLPDPHLQVLARRPDLTQPVSEQLVGRGSIAVHRIIAENLQIQLSQKALSLLIRRAMKDARTCDALLLRKDLTPSNYKQMLPYVDTNTRHKLRKLIEESLSPEQREHLQYLRSLRRNLGAAYTQKNSMGLWAACQKEGANLNDILTLLLQDERLEDVARLLAHVSGQREPKIRDIVFNGEPEDGARLAMLTGLNADTLAFLATVRSKKLKLPSGEAAEWRRSFAALQADVEATPVRRNSEFAAKRPKRVRPEKKGSLNRKLTLAAGF
ncbi:hypothetical protein GCM10011316_01520 [Roseibium aquae]|uniref:DUF2336 domain-containing protein n=1 Tax=Roseibium aquae TaxID=1323746 RepID=A0A916T644_9HYPH|nr:DUF2336 domain-containing protein [Roseibium aquae]GGB33107.1 hypothetical protein GCM10011316_01520 [Roseibium aquae]